MKTWWERASTEDRLAQIDGGIAVGMTTKQVSMNCGAPIYENGTCAVSSFANNHGRIFGRAHINLKVSAAMKTHHRRRSGGIEVDVSDAFDIFDRPHSQDRFIDAVPGER